jgi:hypothetical protein
LFGLLSRTTTTVPASRPAPWHPTIAPSKIANATHVVILAKPHEVVILAKPHEVVILAKPHEVVILAKPESLYLPLPLFVLVK